MSVKSEHFYSSDLDDAFLPLLPYLTHQTPYTPFLLTFSIVALLLSIPLVYLIPFRLVVLFVGLLPFFLARPFTQSNLSGDKLGDKHWRAELRQVEVFENERWNPNSRETPGSAASTSFIGSPSTGTYDNPGAGGGKHQRSGWGKSNLKSGERKAWTRGRDGWSGIGGGGDVRFVFSLASELVSFLWPRMLMSRQPPAVI